MENQKTMRETMMTKKNTRYHHRKRRRDERNRKLANEGFLAKAKPEIVEEQRQRLATMESELKTIEASLAELA